MPPEFGEVLREIRKKNDWTLAQMAEKLGTTKQAISKYERGERTPKITVVAKFSEILNIPMSELAGGIEPAEETRQIFTPDSEKWRLIITNMTIEDYEMVRDAFNRTERKLREEGKL